MRRCFNNLSFKLQVKRFGEARDRPMAAALLLLGLLAAPALALRGAESPWAWNIAVIYVEVCEFC